MTELSMEDRYAVLEERLKVAESAIFGCRAMLNYCRRIEADHQSVESGTGSVRPSQLRSDNNPKRKGLYAGQIDNYVDPEDLDESNAECIE